MANKLLILSSIIFIGFGAGAKVGEASDGERSAGTGIAPMGDAFGTGGPWRRFHIETIPQLGLPQAKKLIELELERRTNKSLGTDGDSVNLISALGQFAAYSGDAKNAIDYLSKSTAQREKNSDTKSSAYFYDLAGLAEAHLAAGDYNAAIEKFKLLMPLMSKTNGEMNVYWLDLAQAYADAGQTQKAEELCDQVLAAACIQKPQDPALDSETMYIGEWYLQRHKYEKAEQLFRKIIASRDSEWTKEQTEMDLLKCFIEQRKIKEASLFMHKRPIIIKLYPNSKIISFRSSPYLEALPGSCYRIPNTKVPGLEQYGAGLKALELNNIQEAERDFKEATRLPDSRYKDLALVGLAKCYQLEGNDEAMINSLADSMVLDNNW